MGWIGTGKPDPDEQGTIYGEGWGWREALMILVGIIAVVLISGILVVWAA